MRRYPYRNGMIPAVLIMGVAMLGLAPAGLASDLEALDALTARWMDLRAQLAGEQRAWQRQQAHWSQELALLEEERARRQAEIEESRSFMSGVEQERADLAGRKQQIDAMLAQLEPHVLAAEADLQEWETWIPPGLQPDLAQGFAALPRDAADAGRKGVVRRLQTVLGLYTEIEALQNGIHVVPEILELEGERRQFSVLYLGFARAFAVSTRGDAAAVGVPGVQGWTWTPVPGIASQVQSAIAVSNREAVAQLVALPMQIKQVGVEQE